MDQQRSCCRGRGQSSRRAPFGPARDFSPGGSRVKSNDDQPQPIAFAEGTLTNLYLSLLGKLDVPAERVGGSIGRLTELSEVERPSAGGRAGRPPRRHSASTR